MKLSRRKGPIYLQIVEILRTRILDKTYSLGENLPPEPQLEKEFEVSKITIRNAVSQLVKEGYVEKHSGKGTKVINNKQFTKLSKGQSFTQVLMKEGHTVRKGDVKVEKIHVTRDCHVPRIIGKSCYKISRMYYLNEEPYIYFSHYISDQYTLPLISETYEASLYELLAKQGVQFSHFQDEFAVEVPPSYICEKLHVKEEHLLKRLRYSYDDHGNLIEYSEAFYNTNLQNYVVKFDV